MTDTKPALKLADQPKSGSGPQATAPEAEKESPVREIRLEGKPRFKEHDICQYNGALVVIIGRGLEWVGDALHWRYLVNLPDVDGRCPYLISAGSWAPEANLRSMEECQEDLKDSVAKLQS